MLYNTTYRKSAFRVKKPIRSFRDLEVYQRANEAATEIITKIVPLLGEGNSPIKDKLVECCLKIPESIAIAHSRRFEKGDESDFLENALEGCNKAVVYLEQAWDIYIKDIEGRSVCEDLIKRYILERRKIFNLYKAWQKFESYALKKPQV
ncbi:MAG: four helix bundle protein [Candidatus Omnitrophota bacterium]|nr:four helix bundle protein [Candidatus Omnitrophota bacterium]